MSPIPSTEPREPDVFDCARVDRREAHGSHDWVTYVDEEYSPEKVWVRCRGYGEGSEEDKPS